MRKILLVYPGFIVREVPLNLLYISAVLKQAGYDTKVFELTKYLKNVGIFGSHKRMIRDFNTLMGGYQPEVVGFSAMTVGYNLTLELLGIAKDRGAMTIVGGIHPTIDPYKAIICSTIDFICVGEAEISLVKLLNSYFKGDDCTNIRGVWAKDKNGDIHQNAAGELVVDLDTLPFPDRDALDSKYYNAELTGANILTSRGCPYHCSFCQNKYLMDLYRGQKFVRYRSFDSIFLELEELITKYGTQSFYFSDETFTLNKKRTLEFLKAYQRRMGNYPFMCQTRADCLDTEMAEALKEAGCHQLNIAIESGNEYVRNNTLNKSETDAVILKAFSLTKMNHIKTQSFNMIGIPGEIMMNIFETIGINKILRPDRVLCTIYMPFKGTELGESCLREHSVVSNIEDSSIYYSQVTVKHATLAARNLIGYQGFFDWYITMPKRLYFIVDFFRVIYQTLVSPTPRKSPILNYFRESIIEYVYKSKSIASRRPANKHAH